MKNKTLTNALVMGLLILSVAFTGCKKDDNTDENEQNDNELITKVQLHLTENGTANEVTVTWSDSDGPGGNAPVIGTLNLVAGKTYSGHIELFDETKTPADAVHEEVAEEKNVHQFFYTPQDGIAGRVTVTRTDVDTNTPPLPVGLEYTVSVSAGAAVTGKLKVVLSHYDGVAKTTAPSDESDIDIQIPVNVN